MIITQKKVEDLYEEYSSEECYDSWDISAKIINQICPRTTCHSDAEYYFHIHSIWCMVDDYLKKSLVGEEMKYNRPINFFEKLQAGWWWTGQIFEEWCYTMTNDEYWEFFNYLQTDYVKYEEDTYYTDTP